MTRYWLMAFTLTSAKVASVPAFADEATPQVDVTATEPDAIIVTARRRQEVAQDVPIALSALSGVSLNQQATFSVAQITQLAPTLQFTSSNPRNTSLNIRGLGVSYGLLANDGLEQGVGFYVDGVYNSRPAAAAFDLLDVERVEILRGPQGTLFGKNTTAGAINITTKAPSFKPEGAFEASVGNRQFVQVKASISDAIVPDTVAGRLSVGYTSRDGFVRSTKTGRNVNDLDNFVVRGQLLWKASDALNIRLSGDYNLQNPDCCTQVLYAYGPTLRSANRQFPALATALGYSPPSTDPYARLADADAMLNARSALGGLSLTADLDLGSAALTSITAWRWWDWQPANDRDYTSLDILRQSANPVQQNQYSQELRLSSTGKRRIDYTVGLYAYYQKLRGQNVPE
jgi:iron complex outermembrane recepter protein